MYGIVRPDDSVDLIVANFMRRIVLQTKRAPIIYSTFGRKSIDFEKNWENLDAVMKFLESKLPNGYGNIKSIILKTTMGKPIRVEEGTLRKSKKGGRR